MRVLFLELFPKLWTYKNFVDRGKRCQLSLTDDLRQFITLSVHLGVQHYGRDASRGSVCRS